MGTFSFVAGANGRALALVSLGVICVAAACSQGNGPDVGKTQEADRAATTALTRGALTERSPNYGPADTSRSAVQGSPSVQVSRAESSVPFATAPRVPAREEEDEGREHRPLKAPRTYLPLHGLTVDTIAQTDVPISSMPATLLNFAGQGGSALGGYPPDTNGAVGPRHFVQTVNTNLEIWNKNGSVAVAGNALVNLWNGYVGTNPGNGCGTRNDGDPVVVYDQLADRWFITQFSLPGINTVGGPSYQCVAVSKTGDPTGAYWLYDFKYNYSINDYGKFGIWPDGYYATFNVFDANGASAGGFDFKGADFCAYDRVKMLSGQPAAQQCFVQPFPAVTACPTDGGPPPVEPFQVGGALPISLDGKIRPPVGAPGWFMQFDYSQCGPAYNQVDLWSLTLDWTTPANSKLTGPTALRVADFTPTCYSTQGADCVPEKGTAKIASLDDRLMFRFTYRNFGTHEALMVNHSVVAGATGGIRWYEIRLPAGTPTLFQQGTYAPSDTNWRWMGSLAQDMAGDMALGYSISSATRNPSIAWTGRTAADPAGTMGQSEAVIDTGAGNQTAGRWGDYSNMTVDPVDDCTFWYTQELYQANGSSNWRTFIASTKFPNCGANDFSIALSPATRTVAPGTPATFTVTTPSAAGVAESIALSVQDLPTGVTGAFAPATVMTGATSTLTLTAAAGAPVTPSPVTFTVIGKAPSAVHAATATVSVATCVPITTCPAPDNCGTLPDGCGGTVSCGAACAAPQTCGGGGTANVCGGGVIDAGADAGSDSGSDDAGNDAGSGSDAGSGNDAGSGDDSGSNGGTDSGSGDDSGSTADSGSRGGTDSGAGGRDAGSPGADAAADGGDGGDGGTGDNGGCGCRTVDAKRTPSWAFVGFGGLAMLGALRRRRRQNGRTTRAS